MSRLPLHAFALALMLHAGAAAATEGKDVLKLGSAAGDDYQLPDLPGAESPGGWDLDLSGSRAALAYENAVEKWDARVEHGPGLPPSLRLAHAVRLSDRLSAGTRLSHENNSSEVVVNAVYAKRRNLRLRLSAAQRRLAADGAPTEQNSYMFAARKYWNGELRSDAGVGIYAIEAHNTALSLSAPVFDDTGHAQLPLEQAGVERRGSLHGVTLNLALQPYPQSRLEFRSDFGRVASAASYASGTVSYGQDLAACSRINGDVTIGRDSGQLGLHLSRRNWSIHAWRAVGNGDAASLLIAYSTSLDDGKTGGTACAPGQYRRKFEPLMDAAVRRPEQFSLDPLSAAQ